VISTTATGLILTAYLALSPAATGARPSQNPSTPATTQQTGRSASLEHLAEAERLLNAIPQDSLKLKKDARKKFNQLREHFAALASAYRAKGDPFVPADVALETDVKPGNESAPVSWKKQFSEVEHDLAGILGGASALPPSAAAAGNRVGAAIGDTGIKDLDPDTRRALEQFRLEVELFFAATTLNFESEATR
jgi:hypothetical protein